MATSWDSVLNNPPPSVLSGYAHAESVVPRARRATALAHSAVLFVSGAAATGSPADDGVLVAASKFASKCRGCQATIDIGDSAWCAAAPAGTLAPLAAAPRQPGVTPQPTPALLGSRRTASLGARRRASRATAKRSRRLVTAPPPTRRSRFRSRRRRSRRSVPRPSSARICCATCAQAWLPSFASSAR